LASWCVASRPVTAPPPNVAPWRCPACRAPLGRILDGVLRVEGRLVTVDRYGNVAVKCARCPEGVALWRPAPCGKVHLDAPTTETEPG
jgi:hypothetical protein